MTGKVVSPLDAAGIYPPLTPKRPDGLVVRLFGGIALAWTGVPLSPPSSARACSLLAYLFVRHDVSSSRDVLASTFWPDRPDVAARRALSNALWQIRRSLGPAADRLEATKESVRVVLRQNDWLDVEAFETGLRRCQALQQDNETGQSLAACRSELQALVELYHADFVEDCYDDWALLDRERLREGYLWALEQLIALNRQWGDYESALAYAQRLAAVDPLRESAHGELMRLYHLAGRDYMALRQYQLLQQLLKDELGVKPTAATKSLYQEIAGAVESTGPVHLPALLPAPVLRDLAHLPFVGRVSERTALLERIQAAARGDGGMALIEGPAGVGKSRLVDEVVEDARWRGFHVALGKADALAPSAPYQSMVEALAPLLTPLRIAQLTELVDPHWLSVGAVLFPAIPEHRPGLPPLAPLGPRQEQSRLGEGLGHCLAALSAITPLLLVLEDLHWADAATLAALESLLPFLSTNRLLVVLTCRAVKARERDIVWNTVERLAHAIRLDRIVLGNLGPTEVEALVLRALGTGLSDTAAAGLSQLLLERTGGNALFLVETLKSMLEQAILTPTTGGGWILPELGTDMPIPDSIGGVVAQRLVRLPGSLRSVLELAAVLGQDAGFPLLSRLVSAASSELTAWLGELGRRGFLSEVRNGYSFEHELVREVVYRAIHPRRRRSLHCRVTDELESLYPGRVESLAHHAAAGGHWARAAEYYLAAGDRAAALGASADAATAYGRALDMRDSLLV